jgi:hypothetical protein
MNSRAPGPWAVWARGADYGPVQDGGDKGESDARPPHEVVGAGRLIGHAAEPDAQKCADLVAEKDEAEESAKVAGAEHDCDEPRGERHGGEPEDAHQGREGYDDHRGRRQRDEEGDDPRAGQVDSREQLALAGLSAQDTAV